MSTRLWVAPETLRAGERRVSGDDFRYLARVKRLARGDEVVLFDGTGRQARARVESVDGLSDLMVLEVEEPRAVERSSAAGARVTLVVALLKGEKMDLVVQKAVELGVTMVRPVAAERAVVKLDGERAGTRVERWRKIAREAARQCGRSDVPEIAVPATLAAVVGEARGEGARAFVLHEGARTSPLATVLPARDSGVNEVIVAVGPEGGWSDDEVAIARAAGFTPVGLGPRVLRAETAALAAVAVLGWALGDLGIPE